ncbi:NrdF Ribonucleotide reductase, beta subunit [uncultured Caudovirales phage]|jgi:ribonucleoside-diphosphate reductase beta chain|uniref:ribonucleoside-diphosphate reductase n=1 Tax=uncultured Caudovirales phage TaxID=2100421 RepID=A0A6J5M3L7_9CAUD|nr:NrdF Ribonucleotide reductase, beta subunit [uncultured Caudovirales phage]
MTYSVFDSTNKKDFVTAKCFLDDPVTIARYDRQKYPIFEKLINQQLGFFWRPEEVEVVRDAKDFKGLSKHEQHIFTSNLKRQILLDSVQGRSPNVAFLPIASLPEIETWIATWAFSETIHSRSYSHIIRNVYPDPSKVFDEMMDIEEIVDCAKDISKNYDDLIHYNNLAQVTGYHGDAFLHSEEVLYQHKKALWLALMSVNILEGIRFYVSFACSWAFAEVKKMEGNAKIIKLIARDENLHLAATQHLLKILPQDDPDFVKIREETREQCIKMFVDAADQEKAWADYLFKDGSMIGLNKTLLNEYVEWITNRRLQAVGLPLQYKTGSNPLPWTQKWISGGEVQVAPQETQITSYIVGGVKKDVSTDSLKGLAL